jgi:hypothetical protein
LELLADEEPGLQVLGDSAYGTAEARIALADAGHDAVVKPIPLRTMIEGEFTRDDFVVDEAAGTVSCPTSLLELVAPRPNTDDLAQPAETEKSKMSCIERFDQRRYPVRDHDIRSVDTDRASGHSKGLRCQLIPMGLSVVRDDNARVGVSAAVAHPTL